MFTNRTIRWCMVLLILVAIMPSVTFGAGIPEKIVPCNGTDCTVCNLATLAQNILNTGIFIAVFLSAVLFAWAGVKMLANQTNPGGKDEAKKIFFNVMVGLLIILGAWLLVDTVMYTFTGSHIWNQLC
ncbi:MAG: hypothetical protein Q8R25_02800 [bacterium]|nr:hypothetical protein [bacterium]